MVTWLCVFISNLVNYIFAANLQISFHKLKCFNLCISDCLSASFCTNGDGEDVGSTGSKPNSRQAGKLRPTSAENCECQCNKGHPTFREDERKCVNDLPGNLSSSIIYSAVSLNSIPCQAKIQKMQEN